MLIENEAIQLLFRENNSSICFRVLFVVIVAIIDIAEPSMTMKRLEICIGLKDVLGTISGQDMGQIIWHINKNVQFTLELHLQGNKPLNVT